MPRCGIQRMQRRAVNLLVAGEGWLLNYCLATGLWQGNRSPSPTCTAAAAACVWKAGLKRSGLYGMLHPTH